MSYRFRSGGNRAGRDVTDTNYGSFRPRDRMANGRREYLATLKVTNSNTSVSDRRGSGGGGGGSKQTESNSSEPAVSETLIVFDPFVVPNNDSYPLEIGADSDFGGGIMDYWCWRGGDSFPVEAWSGTFRFQHDGMTMRYSKDVERFDTRDSNNNLHISIVALLSSEGSVWLNFTASNDATLGDIDVRMMLRAVPSRPA